MSPPLRWSHEAILDALRDFHARMGRGPTTAELGLRGGKRKPDDLPQYGWIVKRFGSVRAAMALAGVPYRAVGDCLCRPMRGKHQATAKRPRRRRDVRVRRRPVQVHPDFVASLREIAAMRHSA